MRTQASTSEEATIDRFDQRALLGAELHLFSQPFEWDTLRRARWLAERISRLSDRVHVTIHDIQQELETARRAKVEEIPTFLIGPAGSARVRYIGVPCDRLFPLLLDDLVDLSRGDTGLEHGTITSLSQLAVPLELRVFAEPGSISAARAVRTAHQFALASPQIRATTVVVSDAPELADSWDVHAVPTVVVNEGAVRFEGALPERSFLDQLKRAARAEWGARSPDRSRLAAPGPA